MKLEWEETDGRPGAESLVGVVRYLEATELEDKFVFVSLGVCVYIYLFLLRLQSDSLDITQQPSGWDNRALEAWDVVFDEDKPLPYARHMPPVSDWKGFTRKLTARIEAGLTAISGHPTDESYSKLRIGGHLGIFGMLRGLEFLRRLCKMENITMGLGVYFHTLKDKVDHLINEMDLICRQEMWSRWASASLTYTKSTTCSRLILLWHIVVETFRNTGKD